MRHALRPGSGWGPVEISRNDPGFARNTSAPDKKPKTIPRVSTRRLSNNRPNGIPSGAGGSWGRVFFRIWGREGIGSRRCPDDRSFPPPQKSDRSCTGSETCAAAVLFSKLSWLCASRSLIWAQGFTVTLFFDRGQAPFPFVSLQDLLAEPQ